MSDDRPAQPRLRRAVWLAVSIAAVLLVAGAATPFALAQQAAQSSYDAAVAEYERAADASLSATESLEGALTSATETRALAEQVLAAATPDYVDSSTLGVLTEAQLALTEALEVAASAPVSGPTAEPGEGAQELQSRAEAVLADAAEVARAADGVARAAAAVTSAGEAFVAGLSEHAASIDSTFASAANLDRIAYREATAALAPARWDADAPALVARYVAAAQALAASHAAEEAEKAGPLYGQRKEVEAFARSIAGGVMLDFDWAPVVNGYGQGGSFGGTATWNTAHGGYSTITLSDSVAALWQSHPAVASLVAHEVGHSITGKCMRLFIDGFDSQAEVFATAWAIGLGYDDEGSGESLYGRPSDALIALSRQCR
ncbi:hypothetical protein OH146_07875 [Salinibacterium sp. SYSU T00001]|uniref:hypothetical protein n=1 Tax=Homoserinimonas sedimenticola TaxID=2986805 RepID=UPI0022364A33|nr:hypothetical protein [Salinibacterium sedimenticola]MCW4385691.1 hypothetical protein [Salinibacterium sedimenticola]